MVSEAPTCPYLADGESALELDMHRAWLEGYAATPIGPDPSRHTCTPETRRAWLEGRLAAQSQRTLPPQTFGGRVLALRMTTIGIVLELHGLDYDQVTRSRHNSDGVRVTLHTSIYELERASIVILNYLQILSPGRDVHAVREVTWEEHITPTTYSAGKLGPPTTAQRARMQFPHLWTQNI